MTEHNQTAPPPEPEAKEPDVLVPEVLPVNLDRFYEQPSLDDIERAINHVKRLKERVLEEGFDFGVLPGTDKVGLLQPGAEKLAFAFALTASFTLIEKTVEPWKTYDYEVPVYDENHKKTDRFETKKARGYYEYRYRCELTYRPSGKIICNGEGLCMSVERGREASPAQTVLSMAQKRALVKAVRLATFSSSIFTGDLEDFPEIVDQMAADYANRGATPNQIGLINKLMMSHRIGEDLKLDASKFIASKKRTFSDASNLIEKLKGGSTSRGTAPSGGSSAPTGAPADTTDLVLTIKELEKELVAAGSLANGDLPNLRQTIGGNPELEKMSVTGLKNYSAAMAEKKQRGSSPAPAAKAGDQTGHQGYTRPGQQKGAQA